jgi:hypothetical protein
MGETEVSDLGLLSRVLMSLSLILKKPIFFTMLSSTLQSPAPPLTKPLNPDSCGIPLGCAYAVEAKTPKKTSMIAFVNSDFSCISSPPLLPIL